MGYSAQSAAWIDYTPVLTGWDGSPTINYARYMVVGNICFIQVRIAAATSNATTKTVTLPFNSTSGIKHLGGLFHTNNSASSAACGRIDLTTNDVMTLYRDGAALAWTASGTCAMDIDFAYRFTA